MQLYKSYNFKTKDPVIDILRTAVQVEAAAHGHKFSKELRRLSVASGVSYACMANWFMGATRKPQYCTVAAVANCLMMQWRVGDTKVVTHKRRKNVVPFKRKAA